MKWNSRILHGIAAALFCLPATGYSANPIAETPLFLSGSAKPNILFAVDDSGSMDFEIVSEYDSGGEAYLFNSGGARNNNYDGGWLTNTGSNGQVPFTERYFFLRSPDYNAAFYNPDSIYRPWPDGTDNKFSDVDPSSAPYEPAITGSKTLNLTRNTRDQSYNTFYPATYFSKTTSGGVETTEWVCSNGYEYWGEYRGRHYCRSESSNEFELTTRTKQVVKSCGDLGEENYTAWYNDPDSTTFTGGVDALAPDGGCLSEHQIQVGTDEMQNFANWFSYYRRLHQATRGAIGEALSGLAGLNLGIFWIHNQRQVSMYDIDAEKADFLDDNYDRFGSSWSGGGTPLRGTLLHAGQQFNSNSNLVTAECQKNYTLLFTDGFNNAKIYNVGNADKDEGAPYADNASNTLADVAMKYYTTRLRSGDYDEGQVPLGDGCYKKEGDPGYSSTENIPVEPTDPSYDPSADCEANLHMNTFTVGFGNKGEHFAGLDYDTVADAYASSPDWSKVDESEWDGNQVDDLYHAAINGRGEFYNATDVDQLRSAMSEALRDIVKTTGAATNVTFNTATLEEGSNVYTASFNSGDWTGSVAAKALNPVTGNIGSTVWDAADTLNAQDPESRFIVTNNDGGVLFNWDNLSTDQQDDLNGEENTSTAGESRLAYLRGDDSNEGAVYRSRSTILGDVVNSSPVYVGAPASAWPDRDPYGSADERYTTYRQTWDEAGERMPVVYAGANDGMLHGFNANTGEEVMAYIPSSVYSTEADQGLHYLTDPTYKHRFYVDLAPTVDDIYIDKDGNAAKEWMTMLIGGLRGGGRGIFALDVTDPSAFSNTSENASKLAMWEFTSEDDARLGYVTEPPTVSLVKWGNNDYRWSVLLPNGYGAGETGMFVLDIQAGLDGWQDGDYVYIQLDADGSGLSPIRAVDYQDENGDASSDGMVDRIYAGDLDGQFWAIDMTDTSNKWGSAYGSDPMFVAKDSVGNAQPITVAPTAGRNFYNTNGSAPNLMLFFGTGKYLSETDPTSTASQSFYGLWDRGASMTRADLTSRTVATGTSSGGQDTRTVSGADIDWTSSDTYGWYFDLPEVGERVVSDVLLRGEYVVFNTNTPTESVCKSGGTSWLMVVRFNGITPEEPVIDVNNDGTVDSGDDIVAGVRWGALVFNMNALSENLYSQQSDGEVNKTATDLLDGKSLGRSGWREIYQE